MIRGLATSREHAVELIQGRQVTVNGAPALKAARQVSAAEPIVVVGPLPRYVSRAGAKLEAALTAFTIDAAGAVCLDAGSSTGGFTDCLLQHGAEHVLAVDVGTGQLHDRLRKHPKVEVREQTDIRSVTPADVVDFVGDDRGFDLVVADLSFIATSRILSTFAALLDERGHALVLVKPQFEAGRVEVSKGRGIIDDPDVWTRVLHEFIDAAVEAGIAVVDLAISPVRGGKGNVEFLAHLRHSDITTAPAPPGHTESMTVKGPT